MSEKKYDDKLMSHEFDGIRELDNDLPPWWLNMFYLTIIWGLIYIVHYHVFGDGALQGEEYQQEMAAATKKYAEARREAEKIAADVPVIALSDEASLAAGKIIYTTHCGVCHGAAGEGVVGPNLTDVYWIHGGSLPEVINTINVGVPEKGMIPWAPLLKPEEINQVASYIISLKNTNPANAKAPEGEKVE